MPKKLKQISELAAASITLSIANRDFRAAAITAIRQGRRLRAPSQRNLVVVGQADAVDVAAVALFNSAKRVPTFTPERARALIVVTLTKLFDVATRPGAVAAESIHAAVKSHVRAFCLADYHTNVFSAGISNPDQRQDRMSWAATWSVLAGTVGKSNARAGWKRFTNPAPILVEDLAAAAHHQAVIEELNQ